MKTARFFVLTVLTVVFPIPVLAQQEPSNDLPLIAKPNPALADVNRLAVVIIPEPAQPNTDGLAWQHIQDTVANKLSKPGISIIGGVAGNIVEIPELRLSIDLLKFDGSQQYVFRVQTSFAKKVFLGDDSQTYIKADVFKTDAVMQAVPIADMPHAVVTIVADQVDAFIHAYIAANPPTKLSTDANTADRPSRAARKAQTKPPVRQEPAESRFVASKNSEVFHKPDCRFAQKISPQNLVSYATREQAAAGKRPCSRCNP